MSIRSPNADSSECGRQRHIFVIFDAGGNHGQQSVNGVQQSFVRIGPEGRSFGKVGKVARIVSLLSGSNLAG